MSEANTEEARVENPVKAFVMAHAEKPFRDALIEYGDELTEEQRNGFLIVAEKSAEKAGAAYESSSGDTISALRENILAGIELDPETKESMQRIIRDEADGETAIAITEDFIRELASIQIDRILARELPIESKVERLTKIGDALNNGITWSAIYPESRETRDYVVLHHGNDGLLGYFLGELAVGNGSSAMDVIRQFAKLEGEEERGLIGDHLPLITAIRGQHSDQQQRTIDEGLLKAGYVWRAEQKQKQYTLLK